MPLITQNVRSTKQWEGLVGFLIHYSKIFSWLKNRNDADVFFAGVSLLGGVVMSLSPQLWLRILIAIPLFLTQVLVSSRRHVLASNEIRAEYSEKALVKEINTYRTLATDHKHLLDELKLETKKSTDISLRYIEKALVNRLHCLSSIPRDGYAIYNYIWLGCQKHRFSPHLKSTL
jgi:hypothetical protein